MIQALPSTSGTTAGYSPNLVSRTTRPVNRVPIKLSMTNGSPMLNFPLAYSSATRPLTPVPVGERSTSPSAKMHTLRLSAPSSKGAQSMIVPYRKPRSASNGCLISIDSITARLTAMPASISLLNFFRNNSHAERLSFAVSVKCPAKADIQPHLADAGNIHSLIELVCERRNVFESYASNSLPVEVSSRIDTSGRRVETDDFARLDHPGFKQDGHQRDHPVATHRAVAFVVHEQHSKMSIGCNRFSNNAAVHIGVSARLEHQRSA